MTRPILAKNYGLYLAIPWNSLTESRQGTVREWPEGEFDCSQRLAQFVGGRGTVVQPFVAHHDKGSFEYAG